MKLAFIGPDMTGKSNIAEALSSKLNIPVFKNEGEWKTKLSGEDYFVNLLRYGGPFLMDFMKQTNTSVILDRFYPCELVYAEAFGRQTDNEIISWMDNEFSKLDGKFIICVKRDYSGLVDDVFPDQLPKEKLEELDFLYRKFYEFTGCDCLILETDDHDIERQTNEIIKFIGV
tara:strand:- start:75 stop:593 length:519 start_codon:yes stop_codon:yes gene_type:complete